MIERSDHEQNLWPETLLSAWGVSGQQTPADPAEVARRLRLPGGVAEHLTAVYSPLTERLARRLPGRSGPMVLGINGAQGTGKSTAAEVLAHLLGVRGFRVCCLSIDDLYLTAAARQRLATEVHPLLRTRGVPGTHDVALGVTLIDQLKSATPETRTPIPRFDKASDDRRPQPEWDLWVGRPHLIVFEGWCVGARPQPEASLSEPVNDLERQEDAEGHWRRYANACLADYEELFAPLDHLLMLKAPSFDQVYEWRAQQEQALEASLAESGRAGTRVMSSSELQRFIQHYERLTRWILAEMPERADLVFELNPAHRVQRIVAPRGTPL
ncbi:phosphoribulokinase [Marinimicrobium sp. C2-29]|uniref:phosphoribulokinase n=1 Tax=Marinimicrobium sp. C2-29 TaxID=3139825 RepID=UPI0031395E25